MGKLYFTFTSKEIERRKDEREWQGRRKRGREGKGREGGKGGENHTGTFFLHFKP